MDIIKFRPDVENEDQYVYRICAMKEQSGLTWKKIADIINNELNKSYDESCYRKRYQSFQNGLKACEKQIFTDDEYLNKIREERRKLEKEKVKLRDERIDYQKSLREDARNESFIELVERSMSKYIEPFNYKESPVIDSDEDLVVCLSDLHAGIEVQNWWNVYNTDILRQRLHKYLDEIHDIQKLHKCKICNVVLGGDMISGLIHQNLRLQNNENVVEQVKIAATYIGEFIYILQEWFENINVYSVSGNHSRLSQSKEDHINGEELDELIPFCLKLQFAKNDKIFIANSNSNCIDSTITAFKTRGNKRFYVIHGDKDTPPNVVENLTLMSGIKPDGIIMGHRHHNAFDTVHGVKIIQCGCVVGVDDYCVNKRISGEPEQCVFITSAKRTIKCLYDIGLN